MSKSIKAQLKKLFKELDKDRDKIDSGISQIVRLNAFNANKIAKLNVQKQKAAAFGGLYGSIGVVKNNNLNYTIVANADYAPYVEFGTGGKVDVPAEWQKMAAELKQSVRGGGFKKGLQSIKDWCRLKGIDEAAAYPIFISILNNGTRPRPFMYPAYQKTKLQFEIDIKKYVDKQSR